MDHREKKYKAHRQFGDRRGGVISARTYFYADEAKCDHHMETFINCIKASGERNIIMNNYTVKKWVFEVINWSTVYKKILFLVFYFSISCLIQCNTCHFLVISE